MNTAMVDNKESLLERNINNINEMADRISRTTDRLSGITDKLIGSCPETPTCVDDAPDRSGISGVLEASVKRLTERVNSIECEVGRLMDSDII